MTRFVGLTGGIGAGKSETLAAFERHGAAVLSTDKVAHDILDDEQVRDALIDRWGDQVASDGEVDRDKVGEIVFGNRDELAWLESVTHPRVGAHVAEWRQSLEPDVDVAVVEVPLLFESEMESVFDTTVAVLTSDEVRRERAEARGHALVDEREARQLAQEEKAARAEHVIENDGSLEDLEQRLSALLAKLDP